MTEHAYQDNGWCWCGVDHRTCRHGRPLNGRCAQCAAIVERAAQRIEAKR